MKTGRSFSWSLLRRIQPPEPPCGRAEIERTIAAVERRLASPPRGRGRLLTGIFLVAVGGGALAARSLVGRPKSPAPVRSSVPSGGLSLPPFVGTRLAAPTARVSPASAPGEAEPRPGGLTVEADAFVDSIGLNVRLESYRSLAPLVGEALAELGVRHVIDTEEAPPALLAGLGATGIRVNLFVLNGHDPHDVLLRHGNYVEAVTFGRLGERQDPATWVSRQRSWMANGYQAIKADPATRDVLVVGPNVPQEERRRALGDVSASSDVAAVGTPSFYPPPGGPYQEGMFAVYRALYGTNKPIFSAQHLYSTWGGDGGLDARVFAKYVVRTFFDNRRAGIARTYGTHLVDLAAHPTGVDEAMGLLHQDGTRKPGFRGIANTIRLLADPGPPFTPEPLPFTMEGEVEDVATLTLARRDGRRFVALWLSIPSRVEDVRQRVTLRVDGALQAVWLHDLETGSAQAVVPHDGGSFSFDVTDRVQLLEFPRR